MAARIIVIDNDDSTQHFLTVGLQGEGWIFSGYTYASAQTNFSQLIESQPDLIILDFEPPEGTDGWAFLQMLKMEDSTAYIPILIIAGAFSFSMELQNYFVIHYINTLTKPLDLEAIRISIQKIFTQVSQSGTLALGNRTCPILLVEDNEDLREDVVTVLGFEGFAVVTAVNGLLALNALYNADYSLILLDISMPVMDGYEFLRVYKQQPRPHSPVIVLSAQAHFLTESMPAFVVEIIAKPYSFSHLIQSVKQYSQVVLGN